MKNKMKNILDNVEAVTKESIEMVYEELSKQPNKETMDLIFAITRTFKGETLKCFYIFERLSAFSLLVKDENKINFGTIDKGKTIFLDDCVVAAIATCRVRRKNNKIRTPYFEIDDFNKAVLAHVTCKGEV